mmetsp:Transcript_120584/g.219134  ORF Transcript_120584/g.219134 Transcript_120584/m.219134 type:complete len:87 (-) Transcript_120584:691-951(-)
MPRRGIYAVRCLVLAEAMSAAVAPTAYTRAPCMSIDSREAAGGNAVVANERAALTHRCSLATAGANIFLVKLSATPSDAAQRCSPL